MFGAALNQNTGGSLFGPAQQHAKATTPNTSSLFGNANNVGAGILTTAANGIFGAQAQPAQPAGNLFGGQPSQGIFGGAAPQNSMQGGFGNNSTNAGGLFNNAQTQPAQGNLFGQPSGGTFNTAPQQPATGLFGNKLFDQPANQSGFGQLANNTTPVFGNQQAGNMFGNNTGTPTNTTGIFGQANNTPSFGQGGNLFGNTAANQGNSFAQNNAFSQSNNAFGTGFGGNNNTPNIGLFGQPTSTQGLFQSPALSTGPSFGANTGTFANNSTMFGNNNNQNPMFATNNNQSNTFANSNNSFGQTNSATTGPSWLSPNNNSLLGSNPAKIGGTSWGVPSVATGNLNANQSIQPVRAKNSKLDSKHLIKCIAALDQFTDLSKEEIRLNYILTGGQQVIQPQISMTGAANTFAGNSFANTNMYPKNGGNGIQTSFPSFGAGLTSNNLPGTSNNLFGGATQLPQANTAVGGQGNTSFGGQGWLGGQNNTGTTQSSFTMGNQGMNNQGPFNNNTKGGLFGTSMFTPNNTNTFQSQPNSALGLGAASSSLFPQANSTIGLSNPGNNQSGGLFNTASHSQFTTQGGPAFTGQPLQIGGSVFNPQQQPSQLGLQQSSNMFPGQPGNNFIGQSDNMFNPGFGQTSNLQMSNQNQGQFGQPLFPLFPQSNLFGQAMPFPSNPYQLGIPSPLDPFASPPNPVSW